MSVGAVALGATFVGLIAGFGRGTRAMRAVPVVVVCALGIAAAPASAALSTSPLPGGSTFQGADGNQDNASPLTDWQFYADAPGGNNTAVTKVDAPLGPPAGDTQDFFFAGQEDTPNAWTLSSASGGITPAKSNALMASSIRDPLQNKTYLYFAFIRENDSNADAFYGFELNKVQTTWVNDAGTTIPCRSNGDLMISYLVQPNIKNVVVEAHRWTADPTATTANDNPACPEGGKGTFTQVNLGSNAQGHMNFDQPGVTNPINNYIRQDVFGTTVAEGRFGEGAINLTDTIGLGQNPCFSFGQIQLHSRSSSSFSSALQDTVDPAPIAVRNCSASGTKWRDDDADGVKDVGEPGLAGWTFWVDYDDDGVVDANEPSGVSDANGAYVISNINPQGQGQAGTGPFRIHEKPPVGVTGYTCSFPATSDAHGCYYEASFTNTGNQVGFDFGNVPPGRIVIKKTNVGGTQSDLFNFTAAGGLTPTTFSVAGNNATGHEYLGVAAKADGSYTVTEDAVGQPAGYTLTNVDCVETGTNDSTESLNDRRATIRLQPNEVVTCTFTNTKQATLKVKKIVQPSSDATTFGFALTQNGNPVALSDSTLGHNEIGSAAVEADGVKQFVFTETTNSSFDLTDISCFDEANNDAPVNPTAETATTVTVTPAPGAQIRCEFTNRRDAGILVRKVTQPDGDPTDFSFDLQKGGVSAAGFPLTRQDNEPATGAQVDATGTYVLSETLNSAYTLTDITCFADDGDQDFGDDPALNPQPAISLANGTASIDPGPGDRIRCDFVNVKKAKVTIVKDAITDDAQNFAFTGAGTLGSPSSFELDDDANATLSNTQVYSGLTTFGTGTVRETPVTDWDLELISCVDAQGAPAATVKYGTGSGGTFAAGANGDGFGIGDTTVQVDVQPGVDVTCTFTNKKVALNVAKLAVDTVVSAGDQLAFTLTTSNAGPGTARNVVLTDNLPAGVVWTIDTQPAGNPCAIAPPAVTSGQVLTCNFGDLAAGESRDVKIVAATSETACAVYDNTANAIADNAAQDSSQASITCQQPDLNVAKTAAAGTVDAGDPISFTVVTSNAGPGTAKGVTVNDPLPAGVDWSITSQTDQTDPFECSITGAVGSEVLACSYGDLASGQSRSVTVGAQTSESACTTYDNLATADATNAPADTASDTITCRPAAVTVVKTPDNDFVDAGDSVSFTIATTSEGPGTAKGVTLNDPLPAGLNWSIQSQTDQTDPLECSITGAVGSQVLACNYGDMADNATRTVVVTATTSEQACAVYDNTATVDATNAPADDDAGKVTCRAPNLAVAKTPDGGSINAGENAVFTVVTTNTGAGEAKGVTLNDPLPDGLTWSITAQTNPGECSIGGVGDDQVLSCTYGDLAPNALRSVTVSATTTFDACATYTNVATADATNASPVQNTGDITCNKPNLGTDKAALNVTVDAGDDISFTVTTANAGPGTAKSVTLTDPLPAGVDWAITSQTDQSAPLECSISGAVDSEVLTCDYGDLAAGATRSVTVTATTSETACATYDNTATVSAANAPNDTGQASITCNQPSLSVDKTPDNQTVDAGDPISFTMVTTNGGPGTAKGVTLNDPLPAGVDWSIASQTDQTVPLECSITGAVNSEVLACDYGDLAANATRSVVVTATTSFDDCAVYDNTVTVDATNAPADTNAGKVTCNKPDLSVVKTPDNQTVDAGDPISFTMVTTNGGPGTAKGVTLSDPLPAGVDWSITSQTDQTDPFECSISGAVGSEVLSCTYGDLGPNATRTVTVGAQTSFDACAVYDNTVTVDATNAPADTDAGKVTCNKPDLGTDKAALEVTVDAGDDISFTVTTTNTGPGTAKNVTLSDPLPDGVTWAITSQTDQTQPLECQITGTGDDQVLTCAYGDLGAGATREVTVTATTTYESCVVFDNTATATAANAPTDTGQASITCNRPIMSIDKSTPTGVVDAGQVARFEVTVTNAGPGTAKNVVVSDLLPAGLTWSFDGAVPQGCSLQDVQVNNQTRQQVTCSFTEFAPGSVSFAVQATTSLAQCADYDNTANVSGSNFPQSPDTTDSASIHCRKGSITIVKELIPATDPGRFDLILDGQVRATGAGNGGQTGKLDVNIGDHSVSEAAVAPASLSQYDRRTVCRDGGTVVASAPDGAPLTVAVADGQDVVCTVTNERLGAVDVSLVVENPTGDDTQVPFDFASDLPAAEARSSRATQQLVGGPFQLRHDDHAVRADIKGSYLVSMADPALKGFEFRGLTCTENGPANTTVSGRDASVRIEPNELVICVYRVRRIPAPAAVVAQAPPPTPVVVPGTARLNGRGGCVKRSTLRTWVTGRQILSVKYTLGRRTLGTVRKADRLGRWLISVKTKGLKRGAYRVRAVVTFRPEAQTRSRTLQLRFSVCGKIKPARTHFTG